MRLTKNELELLSRATASLGKDYQKVINELLISLCEGNDWFYDFLFSVIRKSIIFNHGNIDSIASYNFPEKK